MNRRRYWGLTLLIGGIGAWVGRQIGWFAGGGRSFPNDPMDWSVAIICVVGIALLLLPQRAKGEVATNQAAAWSMAPLQRVGILLLVLAAVLFACAMLGRDVGPEGAYYRAIHYPPYRWFDYAGLISLWLAPVGAVLLICYPLLTGLMRWIRSGKLKG